MERLSPLAFAVAALSIPLLTLGFGLAGLGGNSVVTGGWLLFVNCVLSGVAARLFKLTLMDCAFLAFVACCAVSAALTFDASRSKELALFFLCCPLPYLAGRMIRSSCLVELPRATLKVSAVFTAAAVLSVIIALVGSGLGGNNRTAVLGMHHAQTVFAVAAGCMVFAFIYSGISVSSRLGIAFVVATYLVMTVFFLSLVRFTMVAIIVASVFSLGLMLLQREWVTARLALVLVLACLLAAGSAVLLRPFGIVSIASEAVSDAVAGAPDASGVVSVQSAAGLDLARLPSCVTEARMDHSVEIRTYLLKDALYLLPYAGLSGFGLATFPSLSCLRGYQIHNVYLQTFVELGWPAGALLIFLVLWPFRLIWPPATDRAQRLARGFLLTNVAFFGLLGIAHGSITRALPLFLFLGAASALGAIRDETEIKR